MRCALPGLSDGGMLGADLVCGMLKDERTPSPCKPFNGSDALDAPEAPAKCKIAIRQVRLSAPIAGNNPLFPQDVRGMGYCTVMLKA